MNPEPEQANRRAAAQRYLDVAASIFVEIDRQQRVTLINQHGCALLGYSEDEILGKNWFTHFIPEEQRETVEAIHHRLIHGEAEAPEWAENEVLTASGEKRSILWHNAPLRNEQGQIVGTLSSGEDITGQRKAEQALAYAEARYQRALETTLDGFFLADVKGYLLDANPAYSQMIGYNRDELVGMRIRDLEARMSETEIHQHIQDLLERGSMQFETAHRTQKGRLIEVKVSMSTMQVHGTPLLGVFLRDVTQQKRALRALRESEARARAILENTVDAIITIDEQGTIESFNQAAEKIFGYTAEEAIGQNVNMLMPSPYREAHDGYLHTYRTTGEHKIIGIGREVVGQRKDGTVFPIDLAVSEVHLRDRRIFSSIIRDLSERKRLEREVLEVSAQEQQRIGQELHDGLGSHLTGVAMSCRALARRLEQGKPLQQEDIEEVATLVQEGAQQARLLSRGLNPVKVSDQGLQTALRELAANMHKLSGVPCLFQSEDEIPPQDAETTLHLYRIAQEAVNNALKH
ncbi:MAG TPA: PAS domain S-box protein, partial [Rhodothermales bacterium]|nr:PAS domain S-box protein [Rhodothermales bacterium]